MIAGAEQMGVKTGLSASLLLLASPVFSLIPHGGAPTVREQKKTVSKCQLLVAAGIVL